NESAALFNVVTDAEGVESIRFGLEAIKGCGTAVVSSIVEERVANGPFRSFPDFCKRMASKKVNKKTMEVLIRAGAFDSLYPAGTKITRHALFKAMESVTAWAAKEQETLSLGQGGLFDAVFSSGGSGPTLRAPEPDIPVQPEWSHMEK